MREDTANLSIYDRIGPKGLLYIVWNSTPAHLRWSLPYGLRVYRELLRESLTLQDLLIVHERKYFWSMPFRGLRPRYSAAKPLLRDCYKIN